VVRVCKRVKKVVAMAAEDDGNFFSRWSRRKVQVRTGQPLPADPPVEAPASATALVPQPLRSASMPAVSTPAAAHPTAEAPPTVPSRVGETPADEAPPLTLDDVAQLTPEADFKPFMARQVTPEVRNAAVKKLFTDPHFNVMDGLDIYIDDYSKPSPLSAADMAQMVGAQFLKLVDEPAKAKAKAEPPPGVAPTATPSTPSPAPESAEPSAETAPPDTPTVAAQTAEDTRATHAATPEEIQDDHADLQLQPDHAPEPQGPGRGAG
jgi:hypothetical protein